MCLCYVKVFKLQAKLNEMEHTELGASSSEYVKISNLKKRWANLTFL